MPNDLLERPKGNEYDDDAGWYRGEGSDDPHGDLMNTNLDDLNDLPTASDDDLPDNHPSKTKKKKSLDGDELTNAEAGAGDKNKPSTAAPLAGEGAVAGVADTLGKGFTGSGDGGKFKALISKKSTKAGGGAALGVAGIFAIFSVFGASMYMVHLREMAIGKSNHFARLRNTAFQKRRTKSQVQKIAKASVNKAGNEVFLASLADKLGAQELTLAKNEAGVILGVADNEGKLLVEFENGYPKKGFAKFLESEAGTEFISKLDNISPSIASEWRGIAAKKNFLQRLKLSLVNMFDRAPPDENANTQQKIDSAMANAEETNEKALIDEQKTAEQVNKDAGGEQNAAQSADEIVDSSLQDEIDQVNAAKNTTPSSIADIADGAAEDTLRAVSDDAIEAAVKDPNIFKILLGKVGEVLARRGLQLAFKALDIAAVPQSACKLKGTINFVSHVKNVFLTAELAKFAARIMVSGDEQKAGIVKSESLKLAAIYMGGATASGGMRWMAGDSSARVSAKSIGKYATGANPTGALGSLRTFANKFPGTSPGVCKFVNNGLVQLGTIAVGTIVAIFGGAESGFTEGNGLTVAALQIGLEVALAIATPILIRTVTHQVMTAVTDNISIGDAFTSGVGALSASNASANAARPITLSKKAALERESTALAKVEMAQRSVFDKYVSLRNGDSLLAQIAFASPKNLKQGILQPIGVGQNIANFFSNPIATTVAVLSGTRSSAFAAAEEQCTDEYIQSLGVATDPFCNPLVADIPNLDLTRTEQALEQSGQIDGQGKPLPGSDFEKYIKNCLSGRTNLLYRDEVDKDGGNNPEDTSCIEQGPALAADYPETIYAFRGDSAKPSIWDKITGNTKAYAAGDDETRVPGSYERFTLWYGYLIDSENIQEDVTGAYSNELNASGTIGSTSPVVPTGSATIGSFKNPGITYDKANITLPNCNFTGAQPPGAVRGEQPGAKELQKLINTRYGQGGTGYIFNCRDMSGPSTAPSVHGTGRAVDSFFNALNATELQKGNDALGWLVANAELFGIQYAKFWRVQWTPNKGFTCVTSKDDQATHSTHVHFEVNWDGALRKTPYFAGTPFSESGISVSQEICQRL